MKFVNDSPTSSPVLSKNRMREVVGGATGGDDGRLQ